MTAKVVISKSPSGLTEIELVKGDRILKSIRFMKEEWEDLVKQTSKKDVDPIDVVYAKYKRLHNAGVNCIPLASMLESIYDAKDNPSGMVEREKLEAMMVLVKK